MNRTQFIKQIHALPGLTLQRASVQSSNIVVHHDHGDLLSSYSVYALDSR
ncbi:hypothetical protein ACIPWF_11095 [Paenarthrobacter sp. NPDC089989]